MRGKTWQVPGLKIFSGLIHPKRGDANDAGNLPPVTSRAESVAPPSGANHLATRASTNPAAPRGAAPQNIRLHLINTMPPTGGALLGSSRSPAGSSKIAGSSTNVQTGTRVDSNADYADPMNIPPNVTTPQTRAASEVSAAFGPYRSGLEAFFARWDDLRNAVKNGLTESRLQACFQLAAGFEAHSVVHVPALREILRALEELQSHAVNRNVFDGTLATLRLIAKFSSDEADGGHTHLPVEDRIRRTLSTPRLVASLTTPTAQLDQKGEVNRRYHQRVNNALEVSARAAPSRNYATKAEMKEIREKLNNLEKRNKDPGQIEPSDEGLSSRPLVPTKI